MVLCLDSHGCVTLEAGFDGSTAHAPRSHDHAGLEHEHNHPHFHYDENGQRFCHSHAHGNNEDHGHQHEESTGDACLDISLALDEATVSSDSRTTIPPVHLVMAPSPQELTLTPLSVGSLHTLHPPPDFKAPPLIESLSTIRLLI